MSHTTNQAYWIAAQTGLTPLAIEMPGVAKTQSVYAFGRAISRPVFTLIASLRDPADIGGYPCLEREVFEGGERVYMRLAAPMYAIEAQRQPSIIFMDELTTCAPAVQAALLRVIAEKVIGDFPLREDTWIIAACNPPEQAANGVELEAAMANRLVHLKWEFDWEGWKTGMLNGLNFPSPRFPKLPDNWRDHINAAAGLVAAFYQRRPTLFASFPTDRSKQSGPWPSPRSWTHATICMAAARSVHAQKDTEHQLVEGCVGEAAALEFSTWRESLDLPDPEEVITKAIARLKAKKEIEYNHPDRPDKVIALLSGINAAIATKNTQERWEAGLAVLERAASFEIDVALSCAAPLAKNIPTGARLSPEFVNRLYPKIKKVLLA